MACLLIYRPPNFPQTPWRAPCFFLTRLPKKGTEDSIAYWKVQYYWYSAPERPLCRGITTIYACCAQCHGPSWDSFRSKHQKALMAESCELFRYRIGTIRLLSIEKLLLHLDKMLQPPAVFLVAAYVAPMWCSTREIFITSNSAATLMALA